MRSKLGPPLVLLLLALTPVAMSSAGASAVSTGPFSGLGKKAKKVTKKVADKAQQIFDRKGLLPAQPQTRDPAGGLNSAADARGPAASPSADSGESWIQPPDERVRSGKNYPMQGAMQSPWLVSASLLLLCLPSLLSPPWRPSASGHFL
jgi:hypothetical protein